MIWGYPYSWKHQYSQGGKQFKTASQPIGLFSRVAEVQQGNESRSYAKETHRQKGIDARWCKCSNFLGNEMWLLSWGILLFGNIPNMHSIDGRACLTVFHCSWSRNLLLNAPNPVLWNQVREQIMDYLGETKRQLLRVGSTSKWKRQSLQRWWYVEWHAFLAVLIAPFFVLKTESRSQRNIHGAAFIAICQSLDMQSSILPWDLDYGFWKTTKMEGL